MNDKWFAHSIAAMLAGLAWFMASEILFRHGVDRISADAYIAAANPLRQLWTLQLMVHFIAVLVAAIVVLRLLLMSVRDITLEEILPGIALAGTLRVLVSMDAGLDLHPLWFDVLRGLFVTLIPLLIAAWMLRRQAR